MPLTNSRGRLFYNCPGCSTIAPGCSTIAPGCSTIVAQPPSAVITRGQAPPLTYDKHR